MICKSDKPIPSVIGPDQGWHFVKRIYSKYGECCMYDVDDEWHPKNATAGSESRKDFYTKAQHGERAGINWDKAPLGKVLDAELASMLGVNRSTVAHARKLRKIPSVQSDQRVDWDAQPLGKMPDNKLARELGVSANAVRKARMARKIKAFHG